MPKKVLVVDDEEHVVELIRVNLEAAGFACLVASSGEAAIESAFREKPDLIVLDVMMPGMDGFEVCKTIKDDVRLSQTKVMIVSARNRDRDRMVGREILGADEYMFKPFDIEELVATVRSLLNEEAT